MRIPLQQVSSGLVLGLSAVIYAVSYAALMFQGPLAPYIPYAMAMTLLTAAAGGLYGLLSEEPTLVAGPDSNTSSILAAMLGALLASPHAAAMPLHAALGLLLAASVLTALVYLLIERFGLARLVRFIPFQVMAGFLASTGWLMCSGALNMIAGTPLNLEGLAALVERPWRPELLAGLGLTAFLLWATRRHSAGVVIPVFIVAVSLLVNGVVRGLCAGAPACEPAHWFFPAFSRLQWLPPWELRLDAAFALELLRLAPSFFAVALVGTLTVLLSLGSLELALRRDLGLEPALRLHGRLTLATAALGGYLGLISIGRSNMCRQTGGGRWTGWVIAAVCLSVLFGLGGLLAWIPKAALGALVLYLGAGMLQQWVWNLRREISRTDLLQVLVILACVIGFGFVVGVFAGLLIACIVFVLDYSAMPFLRLDTTLAQTRSCVIRDVSEQEHLAQAGGRCRIGRFDDFVFFGVANGIYEWYRRHAAGGLAQLVLDFSHVRGIDQSALAVLQKVVRAEAAAGRSVILCVAPALQPRFAHLADGNAARLVPDFDQGLELAEDRLLAERDGGAGAALDPLAFLPAQQRDRFRAFLHPVALRPGDALFREGDASDEVYFVESGRIEVVKDQGVRRWRLATVVAGAMVGEMAPYSGQRRSATALALGDVRVLVLSAVQREALRRTHPDLAAAFDRHVILTLAATVQRANSTMAARAA